GQQLRPPIGARRRASRGGAHARRREGHGRHRVQGRPEEQRHEGVVRGPRHRTARRRSISWWCWGQQAGGGGGGGGGAIGGASAARLPKREEGGASGGGRASEEPAGGGQGSGIVETRECSCCCCCCCSHRCWRRSGAGAGGGISRPGFGRGGGRRTVPAKGEPFQDGRKNEQQAEAAAQAGQGAGYQLRGEVCREGRQQVQAKGTDARDEADVLIAAWPEQLCPGLGLRKGVFDSTSATFSCTWRTAVRTGRSFSQDGVFPPVYFRSALVS
ncbi:unnamed protein product, partial [Ectocarpus fasciculatus]